MDNKCWLSINVVIWRKVENAWTQHTEKSVDIIEACQIEKHRRLDVGWKNQAYDRIEDEEDLTNVGAINPHEEVRAMTLFSGEKEVKRYHRKHWRLFN